MPAAPDDGIAQYRDAYERAMRAMSKRGGSKQAAALMREALAVLSRSTVATAKRVSALIEGGELLSEIAVVPHEGDPHIEAALHIALQAFGERHPLSVRAMVARGDCLSSSMRDEEAIALMDRAIAIASEEPTCRDELEYARERRSFLDPDPKFVGSDRGPARFRVGDRDVALSEGIARSGVRIDASNVSRLACIARYDRLVWNVSFSRDGARMAFGTSEGAYLFRTSDLTLERFIRNRGMENVTLVANGATLLAFNDGLLHVWRAPEGTFVANRANEDPYSGWIAVHPDDDLFVSANSYHLRFARASAAGLVRSIEPGAGNDGTGVAFLANGTLAAAANYQSPIEIFRVADGARLGTLAAPPTKRFVVSANDEVFATDGHDVTVSRVGEPKITRRIRSGALHYEDVRDLALTPDASLLFTSGLDTRVHVFAAQSGEHVATLPVKGTLWEVEVSPDGSLLVLRDAGPTSSGPVEIWGVV